MVAPLEVLRLGHVNNIVEKVAPLQTFYSDVLGADVFSEFSNPVVGSSNALLLVGSTCIEIFGVDDHEKLLGAYLAKRGAGWHSLEWTVPSQEVAEDVVRDRGLTITDRADDAYVWLHPRECHGLLLEISTHHFEGDSRDAPGWQPTYWSEQHPLGIQSLNCIRVSSRDPLAAGEWLMDLTGTRITYDEPRPLVSGRAVGVGLADHVIEFVGATGEGPTMDFVNAHGERMHSVAFNVSDLGAAEEFLQSKGIRTLPGSATGRLYLDPAATHGSLIELVSALR